MIENVEIRSPVGNVGVDRIECGHYDTLLETCLTVIHLTGSVSFPSLSGGQAQVQRETEWGTTAIAMPVQCPIERRSGVFVLVGVEPTG